MNARLPRVERRPAPPDVMRYLACYPPAHMRRRWQYRFTVWLSPLPWRWLPCWRCIAGELVQLELGPLEVRRQPR